MKAIVYQRFGSPDVLDIEEVEKPDVPDDGVLVRVRAVAINPADWYAMAGKPYIGRPAMGFLKPKDRRLGVDFSGIVEAVGRDVAEFRPGDEVFGGRNGALAEYVSVRQAVAAKPSALTFDQAAAMPVAALTALQGLRDKAKVEAGQKVLINGASGGVGTFAVQIAKAFGTEVTGVCSTRNLDLVRSLGADHVIDYTQEDFTRSGERYDVVLDVAGSRSWSDCKRVLKPGSAFVIIGGPKDNRVLGPLSHIIKVRFAAAPSKQKVTFFIAKLNKEDLLVLAELFEAGKMTSVIDRHYPLSEVADAFRYLGEGHARGKVIITF